MDLRRLPIDHLLTAREVITILKISRATLYVRLREKKLPPPVRIGPRATRWRASDIAALIEKGIGDA